MLVPLRIAHCAGKRSAYIDLLHHEQQPEFTHHLLERIVLERATSLADYSSFAVLWHSPASMMLLKAKASS
eukprot:1795705-Lingulodinium_polyedra.AAC.1